MINNDNYVDMLNKKYIGNVNKVLSSDQILLLVKDFAKDEFKYINDNEKINGRPEDYKTRLLSIIIYSFYKDFTLYHQMEDFSRNMISFRFLAEGIKPSGLTFQRFIENNNEVFKKTLKRIVEIAKDNGFTEFNEVSLNGTIKDKNLNYMIKSKEIDKIIKIIRKDFDEETIIKKGYKLSKTGYRFLTNNKLTDDEKVKALQELKKELKKSGQKSIYLTATEASWMLNEYDSKLSSNIQSTVNYDSKILVSVNITNQNQLEGDVEDETLRNIFDDDIEEDVDSMDDFLERMENIDFDTFFSFVYNFDTDSYTCPEEEELYLQESYNVECLKKYPNRIKKVYYNDECDNCELKNNCDNVKLRFITDYGSNLSKIVDKKTETIEVNEKFERLDSIKPPFGKIKQKNEKAEIRVKEEKYLENLIILRAIGYNLRVMADVFYDKKEGEVSLRKFMNKLIQEYQDIHFSININ